MISAKDALKLSTAQLSPKDKEEADKLEAEIEIVVSKTMEYRGCELTVSTTNGNAIAEVNQRLKRAGYQPQWQALVEQHKLNAALQTHVGFRLSLSPNDDAYQPYPLH